MSTGGEKFDSLESLVDHYKQWSMVDNSGVVVSLKVALNSTRVNLSSFKKRKDALESTGGAEKKDGFSEEFEYLQQQVGEVTLGCSGENRGGARDDKLPSI